ncbi:MAG: HIT domain-containing protein [Bacilli bacterium]|nr:HIT domain-containing protein [Bacilli bacterium]
MKDCIFCKIINGELPSKTVYEDDLIKVIMNINPNTNGHLLVLPKEHFVNINDITDEIITHSLKVIRENLYPLLKEKLNCEGLTIAENNELGQEIKHFHLHLIPRYPDDNADFQYDESKLIDLDEVFEKLNN